MLIQGVFLGMPTGSRAGLAGRNGRWMVVNSSLQRTNNGVESFHGSFRRLVKVAHPSFYAFVEYLQEVTLSNMADVQRLNTSRQIRKPKKKANVMNDKCIHHITAQYSAGSYSAVQFLSFVCHCSESVTSVLTRDDDGSNKEDDLTDDEDNEHSNSEVTVAATVTPAAASVPTTRDVCLVAACKNTRDETLVQLMATVLSAEVL